jgi:hypothetical protein
LRKWLRSSERICSGFGGIALLCLIFVSSLPGFFARQEITSALAGPYTGASSVVYNFMWSFFEGVVCATLSLMILGIPKLSKPPYQFLAVFPCALCAIYWMAGTVQFRLLGTVLPPGNSSLKIVLSNPELILPSIGSALSFAEMMFLVSYLIVSVLLVGILASRRGNRRWLRSSSVGLLLIVMVSAVLIVLDAQRRWVDRTLGLERIEYHIGNTSWMWMMRASPFPISYVVHALGAAVNSCLVIPEQPLMTNIPSSDPNRVEREGHDLAVVTSRDTGTTDPSADAHRSGIVLGGIQFESLNMRAVHIPFADTGEPILPVLSKLLEESVGDVDDLKMMSPRGIGSTSDAEFSVLCGLEPSIRQVAFYRIRSLIEPCLSAALLQRGVPSFAVHGYYPDFWNRAEAYPKLGFSAFYSRSDLIDAGVTQNAIGPLDQDALLFSLRKAIEFSGSVFFHFVGLQSHTPFEPGHPDNRPVVTDSYECPSCQDAELTHFANAIHRVDQALGVFLDEATKVSRTDPREFVFYIYGDHAPPIRVDAFADASSRGKLVSQILAEDNDVPFVVVSIARGNLRVLSYPHAGQMRSLTDVSQILSDAFSQRPDWADTPLATALHAVASRRAQVDDRFRISLGQVYDAKGVAGHIQDLHDDHGIWRAIFLTEESFGCSIN